MIQTMSFHLPFVMRLQQYLDLTALGSFSCCTLYIAMYMSGSAQCRAAVMKQLELHQLKQLSTQQEEQKGLGT